MITTKQKTFSLTFNLHIEYVMLWRLSRDIKAAAQNDVFYKTQEKLPGPLVSKQLVIVAAYLK